MTSRQMQLALREIRGFMARRQVIAALCGAALLATLAQPFEFQVPGHIGLTLIYWLVVIWITFPLGFAISLLLEGWFRNRAPWLGIVTAALVMGMVTTAIVYLANIVFLGWSLFEGRLWGLLVGSTFPVAAVVTGLNGFIMKRGPDADTQVKTPPLLDRLPLEKRGRILHLAAQDHYTQVTTSQGTELVLLRFSDAVAEVGTTPGLQTHRSHWVAKAAVKSAKRQGDGAVVILQNGTEVPVSRSRVNQLKEADFL